MARKKRVSEDVKPFDLGFPMVRRVAARTIAQDLKPFDPNNPQHVNEYFPQHYNRSHGEKCKNKNNGSVK